MTISEQIAVFFQKYADENGLTYAQAKQYLDRTDISYYSRLAKRYCEDAAKDMAAGTWAHDAAKSYFTQQSQSRNEALQHRHEDCPSGYAQRARSACGLPTPSAKPAASLRTLSMTASCRPTQDRPAFWSDTVLTNLKHVSTIAHASFHGATFSDRIWGTQQAKLKKVLNKALQDCLILGKGCGTVH